MDPVVESNETGGRVAWAIAPGALLAGVAGGIAFPILPSYGMRVGLPLAFIGVILAANRAARIVSNPFVGVATDRFGGKRTLAVGLAIQIVVMFLYWLGVKTSHPGIYFLVGRLLHGPGSSCVFVAAQALALNASGKKRGQAAGVVRGAMAVGVPVGLIVGGICADAFGEARTFELAALALAFATIAALILVPDLRVSVGSKPSAMQSLLALRDARLAAIGGLNFAATFAGSGMVLTTATLLVHARGIAILSLPERTTASVMMGLLVISEALSMPFLGRVGDWRGLHAWIAAFGVTAMVPALLTIAGAHHAWTYALGIVMLGVGVGALGPSVLALIGELVPPAHRGLAIGAQAVCSDIGGAAGPLVGTAVFASSVALPYEVGAMVIAAFVPVAFWLTRVRRVEV